DLLITSVLTGNRNFEGRNHPLVKGKYHASPPLVVAYSLAGTVNINLKTYQIGVCKYGQNVYYNDIWPSMEEINSLVKQ
ncbi:aconitase family protein, partial [Bacillus vallismortis]|nr:aconitase family protein [Bacillus vallismortis]